MYNIEVSTNEVYLIANLTYETDIDFDEFAEYDEKEKIKRITDFIRERALEKTKENIVLNTDFSEVYVAFLSIKDIVVFPLENGGMKIVLEGTVLIKIDGYDMDRFRTYQEIVEYLNLKQSDIKWVEDFKALV